MVLIASVPAHCLSFTFYGHHYLGKKCIEMVSKKANMACVHGSTNGTNGKPIVTLILLVIPLVPMVMPMTPFALPMVLLVPLVSQWCH